MKNFKIFTLLAFFALLLGTQSVQAVVNFGTIDATTIESNKADKQTQKQLKRQKRFEKRMAKMEKKANKKDIDFSDPVDKWLWFAVFGWAGGVILTILAYVLVFSTAGFGLGGVLWLLASLCYLFGSVSFIVWLIKKLS
ncbi:MAG: hypothetical protein KDC44_12755 [Phaeodactylibacter sp.]|nr:hypothetical protein [Phaeodactylibacter sp.]